MKCNNSLLFMDCMFFNLAKKLQKNYKKINQKNYAN